MITNKIRPLLLDDQGKPRLGPNGELIYVAGPDQPFFLGFYKRQPYKLLWLNPEAPRDGAE